MREKKVFISQSNYIPWKGYFDAINMADVFVLYDSMQYTKRDWRNRNKIQTNQGLKWLTIPVKVKGKYHQKINETKISDPDWNTNHWSTIYHNYSKSPFFQDYQEYFEELYLGCKEELLSHVNHHFLSAICNLLKIQTEFLWSDEFEIKGGKSEKLLNICLELGANTYITGPAAKSYLDEEIFSAEGIKVEWIDYSEYPEYNQLYEPFEHGVSIIDLIFNTGSEAKNYMKSFS